MNLEQYRSLYQKIEVPQLLSQRVLQSAEHVRPKFQMTGRIKWKLVLAAICAAVIAVSCFSIRVDTSSNAVLTVSSTKSTVNQTEQTQNYFALAVYAAEVPQNQTSTPIEVSMKDFGLEIPGIRAVTDDEGNYNPALIDFAALTGKLKGMVSYPLSLSCTGKNIRTIQYEIKGDAEFENWPDDMSKQYNSDGSLNTELVYTKKFKVNYVKQSNEASEFNRNLDVSSHISLETVKKMMAVDEAFDKKLSTCKEGDTLVEDSAEERYQVEKEAVADNAKALGECRLILTATFKDNSTQTKIYQIKPSVNYATLRQKIHDKQLEVKKKYQKEEDSAEKDEKIRKEYNDYANTLEPLFTITQVNN